MKTNLNCLKYNYIHAYSFRAITYNIGQFFRNLRFAWQRITKGYCDADVWNLELFYSDLFYVTLNQLADESHGYPGRGEFSDEVAREEGWPEGDDGCPGARKWEAYLREMAQHFYNCNEEHEDVKETQRALNLFEIYEAYVNKIGVEKDATAKELFDDWLSAENDANDFRKQEVNTGLEMMKKSFFDLWD